MCMQYKYRKYAHINALSEENVIPATTTTTAATAAAAMSQTGVWKEKFSLREDKRNP